MGLYLNKFLKSVQIILETLTGRQAFDENMPRDQRELVNYIEYQCEKEKVDEYELRDKRRKWVEQTFRDLFKLACDCTEDNRNARPAINLVRVIILSTSYNCLSHSTQMNSHTIVTVLVKLFN